MFPGRNNPNRGKNSSNDPSVLDPIQRFKWMPPPPPPTPVPTPPPSSVAKEASSKRSQSPPLTLYHPSIYRYNCYGAYSVSSKNLYSEGICRGIRSRLEWISDMDTNTRHGALKEFASFWMDDPEDELEDGSAGAATTARPQAGGTDDGDPATSTLKPTTRSILISPALIYKDTKINNKNQKQPSKAGVVTKPSDENVEEPPQQLLPEEEIIKRQTWQCYGSTEIEYLVLKETKTGEERIMAVAPRNSGLSIRSMETEDSRVTSIGMGHINFVIDLGLLPEEADIDDKDQDRTRSNVTQDHTHFHGTDVPTDELPSKTQAGLPQNWTAARDSASKTYQFSLKVFDHMKQNVSWLYGNLREDFASRTYAAGQKIVGHVPKTIERTSVFMNKMLQRMWNDDDDGSDGHSGGGNDSDPRRRPRG